MTPSRKPRAAANRADMESAPTGGVRCGRVCGWPRGLPGTVGRAFTPAAPQRFKTGVFAPPQGPEGWGIPPYVRPEGRGCPAWPVACHGV